MARGREAQAFQREPSLVLQDFIRESATSYTFILGLAVVALFIVSFASPAAIKTVMTVFQLLLLLSGFVGIVDLVNRLFAGKPSARWIDEIADWSLMAALVVATSFYVLDLIPVTRYVWPGVIFFVLFVGIIRTCHDFLLSGHDHFLGRAIHYPAKALRYCFTLFWIFVFMNLQHVISVLGSEQRDYEHLVMHTVKITAAAMMMWLVNARVFRTGKEFVSSFAPAMYALVGFTAAVQITNYSMAHVLDPYWSYAPVMLATVLYAAEHPLRPTSEVLAKIGFTVYALLFAGQVAFEWTSAPLEGIWKKYISDDGLALVMSTVGIIVSIWLARRSKRPASARPAISPADVADASNEILRRYGNTLESVHQLLHVAILTRDFSFCDQLGESDRLPEPLRTYFRMYVLGAKVKIGGLLTQEDQLWLFEGEIPNPVKPADLLRAFSGRFPRVVGDRALARAFSQNNFITAYVDGEKVAEVAPSRGVVIGMRDAGGPIVAFALIVIFCAPYIAPFGKPMEFAQSTVGFVRGRLNLARVRLAFAYRVFDDHVWRSHYAVVLYDWAQNAYASLEPDSPADLREHRAWLSEILLLNPQRSSLRYVVARSIAHIDKRLGDRAGALESYRVALDSAPSDSERDATLAALIGLDHEPFRTGPSRDLLLEVAGRRDYPLATAFAAYGEFMDGDYGECLALFADAAPETLTAMGAIRAFALLRTGRAETAAALAEPYLRRRDDVPGRIVATFVMAEIAGRSGDRLISAQRTFDALLGQLQVNRRLLPQCEVTEAVARLKWCADEVERANHHDFRTDLWRSLAALYEGNPRRANELMLSYRRRGGVMSQDAAKVRDLIINGAVPVG